jgi:hypothetical protein
MKSFFEWFAASGIDPEQTWVILGKGPSFAGRSRWDLKRYRTMSLNHVVREQPVTVAHMIDFDVVDACGESLLENAQVVVLPWVPHVNNRPGPNNLAELAQRNALLRRLNQQGRLLWYNHSKARQRNGESPVVRVKFFSAVAAINLLAAAGVHTIRSLGVDGGASYSREFDDLKDKTLLANSRSSFDRQFEEIALTISTTGIDYAPLNTAAPLRVYVGATEQEMLPVKVLEYSIRKHASMSVDVLPLHLSKIPIPCPKDPRNRPRTPFSFQRFLIPALTGYQGRAIYLDSDMQVFKDIKRVWEMPFEGADLLTARAAIGSERKPQFSVMVLNCEALDWDIEKIVRSLDENSLTYDDLVHRMALAKNIRADIGPEWNALEHFSRRETALVHFTDMSTQPWVSRANPLGHLWVGDLISAVEAGHIAREFVEQEVASGHVRPSLLYQMENRIHESFLLPKQARQLDARFRPPYQSLPAYRDFWRRQIGQRLRAWGRHWRRNETIDRYERLFQDWLYR